MLLQGKKDAEGFSAGVRHTGLTHIFVEEISLVSTDFPQRNLWGAGGPKSD